MIAPHLDRIVDVLRSTALVVDAAAAAASMTVARQPVRESLLNVKVSGGTNNTGTVTIAGTVSGSADTEVLTFTGAATKRTTKAFTAVSGVTTSGLADESTKPTVRVEAVGRDGNPQTTTYTVATGVAAGVEYTGPKSWTPQSGGTPELRDVVVRLDYSEVYTPRPGDLVSDTDTSRRYLIQTVDILPSPSRPSHWACHGRRYDET